MAQTTETRAEQLRLRVQRVLGHGGITQLARDLDKDRTFLSNILNGRGTAAPTLDLIEERLDEIEAEQEADAKAA